MTQQLIGGPLVDASGGEAPAPLFPASSVLDRFNRTLTGVPLDGNWIIPNWMSPDGLTIVDNQAAYSDQGSNRGGQMWGTFYGPDQVAYCTLTTLRDGYNRDNVYLYARYEEPDVNSYGCYYLLVSGLGDGSYNVSLNIYTPVASEILAQGNVALLDGVKVGLVVKGTTLQAWYMPPGGAWTKLLETTDNRHAPAQSRIGLQLMDSLVRVDDFGGGADAVLPPPLELDNFNRPNEGPPPSASWISGGFPAWWYDDNYQLATIGNKCAPMPGSSDGGGAVYTAHRYGPDIMMWYTVGDFDANGGNYNFYWAIQDPATMFDSGNYYTVNYGCLAQWSPDWGSYIGIGITLTKVIAGTGTGLISYYFPIVRIANGDGLGVKHVGDVITMLHKPAAGDWTEIATYTDAGGSHPAGYFAIEVTRSASGGAPQYITDFNGGTL